jgi:Mn2+/Fe2+ NRAMP family transporter
LKLRRGLGESFSSACCFYQIVIGSTFVGVLMDFLNINPVKALFWTAIINGLVAPFLLVGILIAASDRKLMNDQPSSMLSRIVVGVATLVMFGAAIGMFVF